MRPNQKMNSGEDVPVSTEYEFTPLYCSRCGRFLLLQDLIEGAIQVKCRSCKYWNLLESIGDEDLTNSPG